MITAFKPSKPDRPRTHCLKQDKRIKKRILFVNDENSKRNICTVLIAFQKPTAIWDIKMEGVPQLAVQDLKTTCSKKYNINTSHIATVEYYILHFIDHMNGTQVMSIISNHDFNTKPCVKARGTIKRFVREMHTREYRTLYKG